MKIRLHEIEIDVESPAKSKAFYNSVLGLQTAVETEGLNVFQTGTTGLDFNVSTHLPPKAVVTSFLTDDLQLVMERLTAAGIPFDGPRPSHLGMSCIECRDPDGHLLRINQPGEASPSGLKV